MRAIAVNALTGGMAYFQSARALSGRPSRSAQHMTVVQTPNFADKYLARTNNTLLPGHAVCVCSNEDATAPLTLCLVVEVKIVYLLYYALRGCLFVSLLYIRYTI